jgi:hypothetical protein
MEIDAGASSDNPGANLSVLGTGPSYAVTAVFWSRSKGKGKMYQEVVLAYLGTAPAYPGTALSVPRTSQPMEIDYVSVEVMEIDQAIFTAREVPSWVRPLLKFLVDGQLPADEVEARQVMRRSKAYTIINKVNLLKARRCSRKFIRASVVTTLRPEPLCRKYSSMGFTSRRHCKKQRTWSRSAMGVRCMPTKFISRH